MKHTSKIVVAVMAALTIVSCSSAAVSAASVNPLSQIRIACKDGSCGNINDLIKKAFGKNSTIKEILNTAGGTCSGGNGSVSQNTKPSTSTVRPEQSSKETAVPSQTDTTGFRTAYEAEVLKLVNAERASYGLSPLVQDKGAAEVAHLRAKEIVQSFSHTRPNGSSCFTAAKELGISYRSAGENIAYGYPTPQKVVEGWMNSEGHRKNILSSSFSRIGIGCYQNNGILYWTQFFIG